jgi:predicted adenylyl cyclase CyaB
MPVNIEIKAWAQHFDRQMQLAQQISDTPRAVLQQEDIFFVTDHGRLKLRILDCEHGELIFYDRPDQIGARQSAYQIARTPEPAALREVLSAALPVRGVVKKQRTLYRVGQMRIHLDEVEGLGQFLELEYVLRPDETREAGLEAVHEIMRRLEIGREDLVAGAYIDLLEKRQLRH